MSSPHALVLPYPAQGHVYPLMQLSFCLLDRGFRITFVNTEFNHERVVAAMAMESGGYEVKRFHMVKIPDGLEADDRRDNLGRITEAFLRVMPQSLEKLMKENKDSAKEERFSCFIVDGYMAWSLGVAKEMGLQTAVFWTAAPGFLSFIFSIGKLIEDGVIDENGQPKKNGLIQLAPGMNPVDSSKLAWNCFDSNTRRIAFHHTFSNGKSVAEEKYILCNSFYELEKPAFNFSPNMLPVGPLHASHQYAKQISFGSFWSPDEACLAWLDTKPANSVVYVAFGSSTIFNQTQFHELALGLELMGRPFLWIVRPDMTTDTEDNDNYLRCFKERVRDRGNIMSWCPQTKVLKHPAISCFLSHCGWNSTLEGVTSGVPFLCWPYYADQFYDQSYITVVWRVGLSLLCDEEGIVTKDEIGSKVEELIGDVNIKKRCLALKEMARSSVETGGSSFENLNRFADAMRSPNYVM
ncbi:UDP-glycosyltransferase 83A1-like [Phalaenopsis equestris]|uniref:UDP-glycosyltransferase 83A1-like n=1 Tax=Phalaenopsis equestris TaxID=78828 RepID=UPI0009E5003C|nr:UDP-glycosyltransferase 83A1-like [Phalaenopsis equestris]